MLKSRWVRQGAKSQTAGYDVPDIVINRHEAFGMELCRAGHEVPTVVLPPAADNLAEDRCTRRCGLQWHG